MAGVLDVRWLEAQKAERILSPVTARQTFAPGTYTGVPQIVRVLALRVQFRLENPDNPYTTGNGHFDLRDLRDSLTIDPPPHNKRYFEDQMEAMKNYFADVSDGLLQIQYTVMPQGQNDAYTLPLPMAHYGITGSQEIRDIRLAKFFKDAVTLADTTDTIDFSQYDYVIVFHAGVGQDFSSRDNTPNDLSSRFISFDLLRKYDTTAAFDGIPVNQGARKIRSGVVVPETESQYLVDPVFQTDVFQEIGLAGILIANFGSALGMPDLFNTDNGRPAIGVFGLEDQGAMNANGLIPAEPDPWTKIYMGWAKPIIIESDTIGLQILPRKLAGQNRIYKIPINDYEYYLIENRQRNVVPDENYPVIISRIDTIKENGTTRYDTVYRAGVVQSPVTRVITQVDEYDSGLPGSGILIWHIDERLIRERWSSNRINAEPNNRGIRVVEASGSQDIGYAFSSGPFTQIDAGNRWDFFYKGNEAFRYYNKNVDSVFFTAHSVPPALGKQRTKTGIALTNFSLPGPFMRVDVRQTLRKAGFPQYTGKSFGARSVTFGHIAGDSRKEVLMTASDGSIYAWYADGSKVIANPLTVTRQRMGADSGVYPLALLATAGDSLMSEPAIADVNADGFSEIITVTKNGTLSVWKAVDLDVNGYADTLWQRQIGNTIYTSPLVTPEKRIVIGSMEGYLIVFGATGNEVYRQSTGHAVIALAQLSADSVVFRTTERMGVLRLSDGQISYFANLRPAQSSFIVTGNLLQNGQNIAVECGWNQGKPFIQCYPPVEGFPVEPPILPTSPLSLADINGDGFLEIVYGAENKIVALTHRGILASGFPVTLDAAQPAGKVYSTVLIADVNQDDKPDLIAAAADGRVFSFDGKGQTVQGFPFSAGYAIRSSMAAFDPEGSRRLHLAVPSDDGFLHVFHLGVHTEPSGIRWAKIYGDTANASFNGEQNLLPHPGDDWMPKKKAYVYPNPVRGNEARIRYYLTEPATVKIKIFDLAGDLVTTLQGTGWPMADNEAIWKIHKIQSGVYFAKIEAKTSSGKQAVRTIKIAITK